MKIKISSLVLMGVLLLPLLGLQSCNKDKKTKPELPPKSAFVMETSDFNSTKSTQTAVNWFHAAANVGVWNLIVASNMVIPVAAYKEAFNHEAVQQDDNTWMWTYDVNVLNAKFTAKLYGKYEGDDLVWEMYLSKENEYTDFLWYEGQCDAALTAGTWTVYKNPNDATPFVGITWNRANDETADIEYKNIIPSGAENGGYIKYGLTNNDLNAFYKIYNKGKDNLTDIEWNTTNKNGHVMDSLKFGDTNWHCWDSNLQDVDCGN